MHLFNTAHSMTPTDKGDKRTGLTLLSLILFNICALAALAHYRLAAFPQSYSVTLPIGNVL